jgi:hypothetical protein
MLKIYAFIEMIFNLIFAWNNKRNINIMFSVVMKILLQDDASSDRQDSIVAFS